MSMTINAANYQNSAYPSTQASKLKKTDAEVVKIRQSAVSDSPDQVNLGEDGIAISEVSRQQGTEQTTTQKQPSVPHMDTVEISKEGRAASTRLQKQQNTSDTAEEVSSETKDLSEYTDSELKQMYLKGEITRQEFEEETGEKLE